MKSAIPVSTRLAANGERSVVRRPVSILGMMFLGLMAIYFLVPIYWLIISAFKTSGELFAHNEFAPSAHVHIVSNIVHVFTYQHAVYVSWVIHTILYAVGGGAVATLFAAMAGYAFAKYQFVGRSTLFGVVIGGVLVPMTALALPLYLLFHAAGLVNTVWSVFLPSVVSPFGVYLARIYAARGVSRELLDAGRVDGASEWRIFFTVGLRLMAPALVTIFLFQFVAIWNNFFLPLIMLNNSRLYPLSLGLYEWNSLSQYAGAPTFLIATVITGTLIAVIPLVIAFVLLQRYWTGGLAVGSVKS